MVPAPKPFFRLPRTLGAALTRAVSSAAQAKFWVSLAAGVALLVCTHTFFSVAAIPHPETDGHDEQPLTWSSGWRAHVPHICRLMMPSGSVLQLRRRCG